MTIPLSSGRRMLKASVVDFVTSTSPFVIWPNSEGPETWWAGHLVDALACRNAVEDRVLVPRLRAAEDVAQMRHGRHAP